MINSQRFFRAGIPAVRRYAREAGDRLPDIDRRVLDAMSAATFSIFRVEGCHRGAGVDLIDLITFDAARDRTARLAMC